MSRKPIGIRRRRGGWRVEVRVNRKLHIKQFPLDTPIGEMRDWRDDQVALFSGTHPTTGSFGADIDTYLGRVAAMPTYKQRAAHLEIWARALGRDRPRRSITTDDIDRVLQGWLEDHAPGTVRKRRTALQSFFAKMNGKKSAEVNPVKRSENPVPAKPEARALDYHRIAAAIDAMPDHRDTKKGRPVRVSLSKIRARVLAYTGIPPGILRQVQPADLQLTAPGSVRVVPRQKGAGVEARTLPLTREALDAFKAFHQANAYGPFSISALNQAFKRGCRRAGLDPRRVHLYDLRHSFLTALYLVTRDLATVGRLGLHAEGSKVTARYAKGADYAVDAAAAAALNQFLATSRQLSLKLAPDAAASHPRAVTRD